MLVEMLQFFLFQSTYLPNRYLLISIERGMAQVLSFGRYQEGWKRWYHVHWRVVKLDGVEPG